MAGDPLMTMSPTVRLENHKHALAQLLQELRDRAIDVVMFQPDATAFTDVHRTTWESLERDGYLSKVPSNGYHLTSKGWLIALEVANVKSTPGYQERLGRVLRAMKKHVKGRTDSFVIPLAQLAAESGEPEGFIFNIIDSKSSSTGNARTGAEWYEGKRGRLVSIPVDFNLEPVDIAAALSVPHLEEINRLQEELVVLAEERAQYHCPHCDAELSSIGHEDVPEAHCIVTWERFACGYLTGDGYEKEPCPYGPNWPNLNEFDFEVTMQGTSWVCYPQPKTPRAQKAPHRRGIGRTREEAEIYAKNAMTKINKGERRGPTDMFNNNLYD